MDDVARIRAVMARHRMDTPAAAKYLGVKPATLAHWLAGRRGTPDTIGRLLDVLGQVEAMAPGLHHGLLP